MTPGQNVARHSHLAHIGKRGGAVVAASCRKTANDGNAHIKSRGSTSLPSPPTSTVPGGCAAVT
eukprot:CAMPEP_0115676458 /NCGR_PEP_ID=MMETSP0272-20121206/54704_1 /TAXON_ID=71861 /ORGANISM="Scrippsiella trochoidea, Strain CCMP3099" /LENGTH=63 /DNA_ID=CAMNT_0003115513 /DNA_START=576 /DNA_END=763 /DNA_ORIENTATION=+